MGGIPSGGGPFDLFEAQLRLVRASHTPSARSASGDLLEDLIGRLEGLFEQPLADMIARPFLRRFTNRFLEVMLGELRRRGRRRGMAGQVAFDVTVLAYLFHITSEAEALRSAKTLPKFLLGALKRYMSGRPMSISHEALAHMERRALPWINGTSGAFVLACQREGLTDNATARRLTQHFVSNTILGIRDCRPIGRHAVGRHSVGECLNEPGRTGLARLINAVYLEELVTRTHWHPASSFNTYHASPWTLDSYKP